MTYTNTDPETDVFFGAVREGKNGMKSMYMSRKEGSNDPDDNVEIQLAPDHRTHVPKSRYGVEPLRDDKTFDNKRVVSLTIEDPDLIEWVRKLETKAVQVAVQKSEELWGKAYQEEYLRDRFFKSIIRENDQGMKPMLKVKFYVKDPSKPASEQPKPTQFFVVEKEEEPTDIFPTGRLDLRPLSEDEDPVRLIGKNTKVLPVVRFSSIWKTGSTGFGVSCQVQTAIIWPSSSKAKSIEKMNLGGAAITILKKRPHESAFQDSMAEDEDPSCLEGDDEDQFQERGEEM